MVAVRVEVDRKLAAKGRRGLGDDRADETRAPGVGARGQFRIARTLIPVQIQPHPRPAILSARFARVLPQVLQRIRGDHLPHRGIVRRMDRTQRLGHRPDQHRVGLRIDFARHRQHVRPALKIFHSLLGRVAELAIDHDVALIEAEPFLNECDDVAAASEIVHVLSQDDFHNASQNCRMAELQDCRKEREKGLSPIPFGNPAIPQSRNFSPSHTESARFDARA